MMKDRIDHKTSILSPAMNRSQNDQSDHSIQINNPTGIPGRIFIYLWDQ